MAPYDLWVRLLLSVSLGAVLLAGGGSGLAASASPDRNLAAAKAYVSRQCHSGSTRSTEIWQAGWTFNALYGDCGGGDGHDQRVWFFAGSRFIGTDAPTSSARIIGMWRNSGTIAFLYVLYRHRDPLCCATGGGKVVRFRWTRNRLVRLDPLPARTTSRVHPAARYP